MKSCTLQNHLSFDDLSDFSPGLNKARINSQMANWAPVAAIYIVECLDEVPKPFYRDINVKCSLLSLFIYVPEFAEHYDRFFIFISFVP